MFDVTLLPLIFLTGIATSIQPCLFPLLPVYFSFLVSTSSKEDNIENLADVVPLKQGILSGVFLTLGILCIFLLLALFINLGQFTFSSFLIRHAVEFNLFLAVILTGFGVIMLLNKDLTIFYRFPSLASSLDLKNRENKLVASFLLGLAYTAIAAPCAAPIFLTLMLTTILIMDSLSIFILMTVYSLGAGFPFLLIGATFPKFRNEILTGYKQVGRYIKPITGMILLLISFYLLNIYVFPFYPIIVGDYSFFGIRTNELNFIYLVITFLFVIIGLISFLLIYLRNRSKQVLCS